MAVDPTFDYKSLSFEEKDKIGAECSVLRDYELKLQPIQGNYDLAHLQKIHEYLFQDFSIVGLDNSYDPGRLRGESRNPHTKNRLLETKGFETFTVYSHMGISSKIALKQALEDINPKILKGLGQSGFSIYVADLYAKLDYIHPFPEGNSRTLRAFTGQLAQECGYKLEWKELAKTPQSRDSLYMARDKSINTMALKSNPNLMQIPQFKETVEFLKSAKTLRDLTASITYKNVAEKGLETDLGIERSFS